MKKIFVVVAWLLGTSLAWGQAVSTQQRLIDPAGGLEEAFRRPPVEFRSMPLWHLNGTLTTEGIRQQLETARAGSGFGGVAVLPVSGRKLRDGGVSPGTEPKYLSEEYFARYGEILDTCQRLGMNVVFYDDIDFPSGSAGGLLARRYPEARAKRLDKIEADVTGPAPVTLSAKASLLMGAVAMNLDTHERRDLTGMVKGLSLRWDAPPGRWKVILFVCVTSGHLVDYLCPEAIDKFLSLTYDEYYRRFARHFGTTIFMTFFDDVTLRANPGYRTWTPSFNAKFEKRYGFSPVPYYPALWYDIGPETAAARVALFGFRAELMAEGYPRKIHEWAQAHGIRASGHAMGAYGSQPAFMAGDNLTFYRHVDIPLMDSIHFYGHGRPGFKLTSSAAWTYDRPLAVVELYGNYPDRTVDQTMLYRSGMELFARGMNVILPHGMWYDPAKVRIPPLISDYSPKLGPGLARYNDFVGRTSVLLRGGRHAADLGVLYPVTSALAYARLDPPKEIHPKDFVPPEFDCLQLSDLLTGAVRRDFTFLHPEVLDGRCKVEGAKVHLENAVNWETYRVLVIPGGQVIAWNSLQKIKAFFDAGGRVIATTRLPEQAAEFGHDADVRQAVAEMFGKSLAAPTSAGFVKRTNAKGGSTYFIPQLTAGALAAALDDALPEADVKFASLGQIEKDKGMLSYLHKFKDGRDLYYFANSMDEPVDMPVTLRGNLAGAEWWDPHTGEIRPVEDAVRMDHGQPRLTRLQLVLKPVSSVFLVGRAGEAR